MSTISIEVDDDLIARARQLAAARKMTVSAMLERLLRVAAGAPLAVESLPPITRQALGMLPPLSDEQVDRLLDEQRTSKYEKS
ncbi:MAG: ribbon-helix-helix protein, CopG family [Pirellulales bacterium]|nr:ribbon-helix-helix protein, CopG family [Pirellulales bacterium]